MPGSKVEPLAAIRRDSVPVRLIDRHVRVLLHANDLVIFDGRQQVAVVTRKAKTNMTEATLNRGVWRSSHIRAPPLPSPRGHRHR